MNSPEKQSFDDTSFELSYGKYVVDLVVQSRMGCHDRQWLAIASSQLTDMITNDSGLERDLVRKKLNDIWTKVLIVGPAEYSLKISEISTS